MNFGYRKMNFGYRNIVIIGMECLLYFLNDQADSLKQLMHIVKWFEGFAARTMDTNHSHPLQCLFTSLIKEKVRGTSYIH